MITKLKEKIIIAFGSLLLRAIWLTLRVEKPDEKIFKLIEKPLILSFWHSKQLFIGYFTKRYILKGTSKKIYFLASQHRDGRLIAELMRKLGFYPILGSSSRGAIAASRKIFKALAGGDFFAITPDGPRGPARKVKAGAVKFASGSGVPICVVSLNFSSCWKASSWDQMEIPKPFARVSLKFDGPLVFSGFSRDETEAACLALETALNRVSI
ncbi:MAG TPA: lysophospholipid acyltransferase family protein [Oligoflexia bacterium]|mgnify:CR=1 FL=1|nr:lysophospholipid acyltransferase family protein [Oligoflexia bacterium]HMP27569.1 lysophospholipid acyltransferase family protein [Oligoflexia bacterium]